jgi:hypothetical protein
MKMRGIAEVLFTFPRRIIIVAAAGDGKAEDMACVTTSSFRVVHALRLIASQPTRQPPPLTATTCTAFSPHCAEDRHGPRRSQHETESPKQSDCTLPPEDCEAAAFREKSDLRTYLQSVSNRESNMPLLNLAPRVDFSLCLSIFFRARDVCAFPPFPRCKMTTPLSPVSLKSPRL